MFEVPSIADLNLGLTLPALTPVGTLPHPADTLRATETGWEIEAPCASGRCVQSLSLNPLELGPEQPAVRQDPRQAPPDRGRAGVAPSPRDQAAGRARPPCAAPGRDEPALGWR